MDFTKETSIPSHISEQTSKSLVNHDSLKSIFSNSQRKARAAGLKSDVPPPVPSHKSAPVVQTGGASNKEDGWEREFQKLDQFLNSKGLRIERVESDGSCMFWSFSKFFEASSGGKISSHELRQEAVDYMLKNGDDFAPFIDTDIYVGGLTDYCSRMRKRTTWGGQLELQALSRARNVNVYVFQTGGKSTIKMINFDEDSTPCVTISYHDGEHYNAVLPLVPSDEILNVDRLESLLRVPDELPSFSENATRPSRKKKTGLFN